jgi:hypothetical protein
MERSSLFGNKKRDFLNIRPNNHAKKIIKSDIVPSTITNTNKLMTKAKYISIVMDMRQQLGFVGTFWNDMPDEYIILPFVHKSGFPRLPKYVQIKLINKNIVNYERIEFLGDSVLKTLQSNIIYSSPNKYDPHYLTNLRNMIENNVVLGCYLYNMNDMCSNIITRGPVKNKACGDVFEAIIGIMFHWMFYDKGYGYCSIDHILEWMIRTTPFVEHIKSIKSKDILKHNDNFCKKYKNSTYFKKKVSFNK